MKINAQQTKQLKKLAQKYRLNFLVLFGSQAEKTTHKFSDIDIAYSPKKDFSYLKEAQMQLELTAIFKNKNVDIINVHEATPLLLHQIATKGQLLIELTPHSFANFQIYAMKIYIESKRIFEYNKQFIKS